MIQLPNTKVSKINSNPIAISDAMAIVRSVPSEKAGKSLFQTLVKASRTQKAEETVLVFDNYSNNQKFFLNQQSLTDGTIRVNM